MKKFNQLADQFHEFNLGLRTFQALKLNITHTHDDANFYKK